MDENVIVNIKSTDSKSYQIKIGSSVLDNISDEIRKVSKAKKLLIITDTNIYSLHYDRLAHLLSEQFEVSVFTFPAGESQKNVNTLQKIWQTCAENKLGRDDALIAFGGGVVGDLTGFAASTYMRGIDFIQIPTSLLAMVDSSIGGKTAIDLPFGKNLAGTFYQPKLVICDMDFLQTLPEEEINFAMAEVIKTSFIEKSVSGNEDKAQEPSFFKLLQSEHYGLEEIVSRSIKIKSSVIEQDEKEQGIRTYLNLGHTFAHAIETSSNYQIPHGEAVALGLRSAFFLAKELSLISDDYFNQAISLMDTYGQAKHIPFAFEAEELYQIMQNDKKNRQGILNIVLPTAPQKVKTFNDLPKDKIIFALNFLKK